MLTRPMTQPRPKRDPAVMTVCGGDGEIAAETRESLQDLGEAAARAMQDTSGRRRQMIARHNRMRVAGRMADRGRRR